MREFKPWESCTNWSSLKAKQNSMNKEVLIVR
nr:MAG TPA: hypothetical protein [Caudoviricetes sp.]